MVICKWQVASIGKSARFSKDIEIISRQVCVIHDTKTAVLFIKVTSAWKRETMRQAVQRLLKQKNQGKGKLIKWVAQVAEQR